MSFYRERCSWRVLFYFYLSYFYLGLDFSFLLISKLIDGTQKLFTRLKSIHNEIFHIYLQISSSNVHHEVHCLILFMEIYVTWFFEMPPYEFRIPMIIHARNFFERWHWQRQFFNVLGTDKVLSDWVLHIETDIYQDAYRKPPPHGFQNSI